ADRGKVDYDAPVAAYWPAFARNGKAGVTVRHALTHRAGLQHALLDAPTFDDLCDWPKVRAALEEAAPVWEPGSRCSYHYFTFGWLLAGVVEGASGLPLAEAVRSLYTSIVTIAAGRRSPGAGGRDVPRRRGRAGRCPRAAGRAGERPGQADAGAGVLPRAGGRGGRGGGRRQGQHGRAGLPGGGDQGGGRGRGARPGGACPEAEGPGVPVGPSHVQLPPAARRGLPGRQRALHRPGAGRAVRSPAG
ncbi:unnamed protein product, partial [Heterosigma akashiwo]